MSKQVTKQEQFDMAAEAQAPLPAVREQDQAASLLEVVAQAARDPACDVNKMRALLEMKRELERDEAKRIYAEAMNRVQEKIRPIAADAANPSTKSRYASYYALDKALRSIYAAEGFSLNFDTGDCPVAEHVRVVCDVAHVGGHERRHHIDMPADGKGAKGGDVMTKTHATGSAVSYGKRYLLGMIFNVAVGIDDDGNAAGAVAITEDEAKAFKKMVNDLDADEAKLCAFVGVEKVEDMTVAQLKRATVALNEWARNQRKQKADA